MILYTDIFTSLTTTIPSITVDYTCVQSISIRKYGKIVLISLCLKFGGMTINTPMTISSDIPEATANTTTSTTSVPNEYGNSGTCLVFVSKTTLTAKCSAANNYYYPQIMYLSSVK